MFLWVGKNSTKANADVARAVTENWLENPPNGVVNPKSKLSVIDEGQETNEFKKILGITGTSCISLSPMENGGERPRVFHLHLCASSGTFSFEETRSTFLGNPEYPRPVFPALQQNLYDKTSVPEGFVGQPG